MTEVFNRFSLWLDRFLVGLDQLFAVWFRGWFYVWGGGELPSADETLSAWVGRSAVAGKPWALRAEKIIDKIMLAPGHCRRAVERDGQD